MLYDDYVSQIWESLFLCNFTSLTKLIEIDKTTTSRSNSLNGYVNCQRSKASKVTCLARLEATCKSKSLRVFKTVRSTMESAKAMLSRQNIHPDNFRLIHLMRDPRAQFQSRLTVSDFNLRGVQSYNERFCARGHKDITLRNELSQLYPQSFFGLHYEDLAHEPLKYAELVYRFVNNRTVPAGVKRWLTKSTLSKNNSEARFGTSRKNSSKTAEAWKGEMTEEIKKQIDGVCSNYYDISDYHLQI